MDPIDYPFKVVTKKVPILQGAEHLKIPRWPCPVPSPAPSGDLLFNFSPSPTSFFRGGQLPFAAAHFQPEQRSLAATTS